MSGCLSVCCFDPAAAFSGWETTTRHLTDLLSVCLGGKVHSSVALLFLESRTESMFVFNSRLIKYVVIYSRLNQLKVKVDSARDLILFYPQEQMLRIRVQVG